MPASLRYPDHPGEAFDPDLAYDTFVAWALARGITLYPAQDEAIIEIVTGVNVILSTPTGTGKSLVAVAAHFTALAQGTAATTRRRSRRWCPRSSSPWSTSSAPNRSAWSPGIPR